MIINIFEILILFNFCIFIPLFKTSGYANSGTLNVFFLFQSILYMQKKFSKIFSRIHLNPVDRNRFS